MIMINEHDRYSISADNVPTKKMMVELIKATCIVAEDTSMRTGKDLDSIIEEAFRKAILENHKS